jgi:hypothetical protein
MNPQQVRRGRSVKYCGSREMEMRANDGKFLSSSKTSNFYTYIEERAWNITL